MIATHKKEKDFLNRLKGKCYKAVTDDATTLILIKDIIPFVKDGIVDGKIEGEVYIFANGCMTYQKLNFDGLTSIYLPNGIHHNYVTPIDKTLIKKEIENLKRF